MAASFLLPSIRAQPKRLNLSNKRLGQLPKLIGKLVCVNHLQLQHNSLTNLPREFGELVQLVYLNLGKNKLDSLPVVLQYCSSLLTLHLFSNEITCLTPCVLGGLSSLTYLNLNNNLLTELPPEIFRLTQLTFLSVDHNQISQLPFELCALGFLHEIHIAFNRLTSLPLEFGYLINLRKLYLQANQLRELPESLCKCINLKVLDVAGNQLRIFPTEFCRALTLKEFHFEENPILKNFPVHAVQEEEALSLKETTARFIMRELKDRSAALRKQLTYYPLIREMLAQSSKCAICGEAFLNTWLECVTFSNLSKDQSKCLNNRDRMHMTAFHADVGGTWRPYCVTADLTQHIFSSSFLHSLSQKSSQSKCSPSNLPIRALLCSYKCFNMPGHSYYGVAFP